MPPTVDDKTLSPEQDHRKVGHDTELMLAKHQTEVSSLCMQVNAIELEIESLR